MIVARKLWLGAALAVLALGASARAGVAVGQRAPDFGGSWKNHESTTLAEQKGRVILLDFWRTW